MSEFNRESDRPASGLTNDLKPDDADEARDSAGRSILGQATLNGDDLRESLAALLQLEIGALDLEDLLTRVAQGAVAAIPGAEGAGLTLLEKTHSGTIVASTPFVTEVDAIQYSIGEGPGITAALDGHTVRSGGLSTDTQWPQFGPKVAGLGVHSVVSLPLLTPDLTVIGAMNVYAHRQDAFSDDAVRIGELFAEPAAIAVQNAQVLAQTKRLADQLQTALISRAVIDQALGILMSRVGGTAEQAFDRLRGRSQADNVKLREVAQKVVDAAVRRARAARAKPGPFVPALARPGSATGLIAPHSRKPSDRPPDADIAVPNTRTEDRAPSPADGSRTAAARAS
jgi:GAF domain-containing protein